MRARKMQFLVTVMVGDTPNAGFESQKEFDKSIDLKAMKPYIKESLEERMNDCWQDGAVVTKVKVQSINKKRPPKKVPYYSNKRQPKQIPY
jgi:hypothetical protein